MYLPTYLRLWPLKIAGWNATTYEICVFAASHCKHSEGCLHGGVMWFGALQDTASGVAETLAHKKLI